MLVHRDHRMSYFEDETMLAEILEVLWRPWYRRVIKWPWFAWEIEADSNEILYYFWASSELVGEEIRKKILGKHPSMEITRVKEKEIALDGCGFVAASSMKLEDDYPVPIKSFFNEIIDSQAAIVNSISDLKEGQKCLIQILAQPAVNCQGQFDKALEIIKSWDAEKEFKKRELFETNVFGKQTKLLADCQIRIMAGAEDKMEGRRILSEVSRSFGQFTSEALNGLKPVERWMHIKPLILFDIRHRLFPIVRRMKKRMILNIEELSGIVRLPSEKVQIARLTRLRMKAVEAPPGVQEIEKKVKSEGVGSRYIHLGVNHFRMKTNQVYMDLHNLRNHVNIVGGSGVGKTTFLVDTIMELCERKVAGMPFGFCLIDPLGGLAQEVGTNLPKELWPVVNYIQPNPTATKHFPLNIFDVDFSATYHSVSKNIADAIGRIWPEGWGVRPEKNFLYGGIALQRYGEPSIINMERILRDASFCKAVAQHLERLPDFEQKDVIIEYLYKLVDLSVPKAAQMRMKSELTESTLNKLDHFALSTVLNGAMGAATCGIRWLESMNRGYINIIDLSKIENDHEKKMIGSLALTMNQQAAISRVSIDDNFLYPIIVDEYHMFIEANPKVVKEMADTTRQKNVPLVLAAQGTVTQLDATVVDAVFRNFNTHIAFRVNHEKDAKFVADNFNDPNITDRDYQSTPENFAYVRLNLGRSTSTPFSIMANAPKYSSANKEVIQQLVDTSIDRAMIREEERQQELAGMRSKKTPAEQASSSGEAMETKLIPGQEASEAQLPDQMEVRRVIPEDSKEAKEGISEVHPAAGVEPVIEQRSNQDDLEDPNQGTGDSERLSYTEEEILELLKPFSKNDDSHDSEEGAEAGEPAADAQETSSDDMVSKEIADVFLQDNPEANADPQSSQICNQTSESDQDKDAAAMKEQSFAGEVSGLSGEDISDKQAEQHAVPLQVASEKEVERGVMAAAVREEKTSSDEEEDFGLNFDAFRPKQASKPAEVKEKPGADEEEDFGVNLNAFGSKTKTKPVEGPLNQTKGKGNNNGWTFGE
ncbi:hypothetical protein AV654_19495 [Paenibacillus elgii]|uniref:Helicase HerA central domain-containing protein n=2 Tax=Paenibacillus elgii TaxID=189691 RepID=A0A165R2X9_9BACL|nr:hypothetical protein AV654_19495 [Paenibacillus elgii]